MMGQRICPRINKPCHYLDCQRKGAPCARAELSKQAVEVTRYRKEMTHGKKKGR